MELDDYCRSKYGSNSRVGLVQNDAKGWVCVAKDGNHSIDMSDVCRSQWGPQSKAILDDVNNFRSWHCSCP